MVIRWRSLCSQLYLVVAIVLVLPAYTLAGSSGSGVAAALDPRSFRSAVSSALARVQGEATQRLEGGREKLRRYQSALKELTQQVSRIDVIDEVDRCLDTLAVSVDEGGQMVKEALESVVRPMRPAGQAMIEAKARLTEQLDMSVAKLSQEIDGSVARIQQAFTQMRSLTAEGGVDGEGAVGRRSRLSFFKPKGGRGGRAKEQIESLNERTLRNVLKFVQEQDGWEHVTTSDNVTVYRKFLDLSGVTGIVIDGESIVEGGRGEESGKFACIKAIGVIDAPVEKVFELFLDNTRVHEYNEHCREIADIDRLSEDTKVTWSASGRYGPFRARDACTIVHFRKLRDGSLVVINRAAEHVKAPRSDKYVRSQVLLAGNVMRAHPTDPGKTLLTTLTHINPGGCVDTKAGAAMINMITATSPVLFHRKVEVAARKAMREREGESEGLWGDGRLRTLEHFIVSSTVV